MLTPDATPDELDMKEIHLKAKGSRLELNICTMRPAPC